MLGTFIIWLTFVAAIASAYLYLVSVKKKKILELARGSFYLAAIGIAAASVLLWIYILQHSFEYHYITRYSSRDLPIELLITSFWAGQEGSFLLWALIAVVIGLILRWHTGRIKMEREANPMKRTGGWMIIQKF